MIRSAPAVELTIDRLVLRGTSLAEGERVAASIRSHLAPMLQEGPSEPWRGHSIASGQGSIAVHAASPEELGYQIATALWEAIQS